ncbi:hypothetical protein CDL12_16338 [Handroanthus impetiginosus]|uniref:Transmembrane protein n=1 Tax=Handroanthus impetiginosus TaxID=429701 RepID=A0A2G9H0K5_9LAMI|nr:hypothetical protein CDL12_16338 [Handroanthus impetiginosus]
MSRLPFFMAIVIIALLILFLGDCSASRPLAPKQEDYTMFKPKIMKGFGGTGVEDCLPKGRRHSSAPSRYINYQPLGSTICSSIDHQAKKP